MTTSKDISGGSETKHQCSQQITGKGGVHTCKHNASHFEEGKHWCSLHAPTNVVKKAERKKAEAIAKEAERLQKREAKQAAPENGESATVAPALKLPETVEEAARLILVLGSEAQSALARMSNMSSKGWPENTPAENYKVILQTINDEAKTASEDIRSRMAKARQVLDPVGYPQG